MIQVKKEKENSVPYVISMTAKDGKEIYVGTFLLSEDTDKYNNILTIYTDAHYKLNCELLSNLLDIIKENHGNIDFAIMTSNIFREWRDKDRYTTENII